MSAWRPTRAAAPRSGSRTIPASDGSWRTIVAARPRHRAADHDRTGGDRRQGHADIDRADHAQLERLDAGSGIAGYELEQNRDGAGFESVATGF
jgi:hypothetical protein